MGQETPSEAALRLVGVLAVPVTRPSRFSPCAGVVPACERIFLDSRADPGCAGAVVVIARFPVLRNLQVCGNPARVKVHRRKDQELHGHPHEARDPWCQGGVPDERRFDSPRRGKGDERKRGRIYFPS